MERHEPHKQWRFAGGLIVHECGADQCGALATVRTRDVDDAEHVLCPNHWRLAMRGSRGFIETIRLEQPRCFRVDCADWAAAVMDHLDGTPLPVCQRHWDDLSWVDPGNPGSQALLDENLAPRWYR